MQAEELIPGFKLTAPPRLLSASSVGMYPTHPFANSTGMVIGNALPERMSSPNWQNMQDAVGRWLRGRIR